MSVTEWGPWRLGDEGQLRVSGPRSSVEFTSSGVAYLGVDSRDAVPWGSIRTLAVQIPTMGTRRWQLSRLIGWLSPQVIVLDRPEIVVGLIGRTSNDHREWILGLPERPFSALTRHATLALLDVLERDNCEYLLGDPAIGPELLTVAMSASPRDRLFVESRIRRAVSRAVRMSGS